MAGQKGLSARDLITVAVALIALWFVAVVVAKVVALAFKLALIVGLVLLVVAVVRRGAETRRERIRRPR
jgi:hypothetical protein